MGLLLLHLCLLAFMGYCIWVESGEVHLVEFSPGGKAVAMGIEAAILSQAVIALPVLLWILVTLRREDCARLPGRAVLETDSHTAGKIETARG